MPSASDLFWRLTATGEVSVSVHVGGAQDVRLAVTFEPIEGDVRVAARDEGLTNFRSVVATVAHSDFATFARDVVAAIDGPGGDCGTHGFWVTHAHVHLPLSTRTLEGRAHGEQGFSSEPVAHSLIEIVERTAGLPDAKVESWRTVRRHALLKTRFVPATLVLLGVVYWLWMR